MEASQVEQSMDHSRSICPPPRRQPPAGNAASAAAAANHTSQELVMSNDGFHWCAEMDYQFGQCDNNSFRSNPSQQGIFENSTSEISFTSNSDSSTVSPRRYKNFDIHLAQIDIETFRSEDIERISHNSFNLPMEDSTDTLRVVESLRSMNVANDDASKHLQPPGDDCEAISVDSLDLSIDNEINAQLIQKCSERDKTRYKIAMIDTSVHSQMQNSAISNSSDIDCSTHSQNNNSNFHNRMQPNGFTASTNLQLNGLVRRTKSDSRCSSNPFVSQAPHQHHCINNIGGSKNSSVDTLQSPGSLVQMFIQNRVGSNESSVLEALNNNGNYLSESLSKCDIHNIYNNLYARQHSQGSEPMGNYAIEELEEHSAGHSLNTVDSNELPLHVLDLSKKLRSMNLGKQARFGSTSASFNTSFTSTTTSSSATFDRRRPSGHTSSSTNPFLQMTDDSRRTRTTSTQFPEMFQDKEVQASFEEDESREAPVLVYYPNYSLPDLSFLQDIFKQENSRQPIYLSPVKHEPPRMVPEGTATVGEVKRRAGSNSSGGDGGGGSCASQRKCRPKSYTDYEMLLSQEINKIKDWDSLNLLLPDDFKEFVMEKNLLRTPSNSSTAYTSSEQYAPSRAYPIKATIPTGLAPGPHSVKLRSHTRQQQPSTKRYSLQEAHYGLNYNNAYNPQQHYFYGPEMDPELANLADRMSMTRSQTMPNCRPGFQPVPMAGMAPHCAPVANFYHNHNCCRPCCHSGCHSPSFNSSQNSPSKPHNFNWDMLTSSRFQKLLSFLSKLDECASDHSNSSKADDTQKSANVAAANSIKDQRNANANLSARGPRAEHRRSKADTDSKASSNVNCPEPVISRERERPTSMRAPSKLELKSVSKVSTPVANKAATSSKVNSHSKATSPMSTNRDLTNRRPANAPESRTKIILRRPTALKSGSSSSGIPVPKRTSSKSMIPTLPGKGSTAPSDARTKERLKSGVNHMRF